MITIKGLEQGTVTGNRLYPYKNGWFLCNNNKVVVIIDKEDIEIVEDSPGVWWAYEVDSDKDMNPYEL